MTPPEGPQYCEDCRHCKLGNPLVYLFNRIERLEFARCMATPYYGLDVIRTYLGRATRIARFCFCDSVRMENPDPAYCPKYEPK